MSVVRACAKQVVHISATLCVLPVVAVVRVAELGGGGERVFTSASQAFSLLPGLIGTWLRSAFLSHAAEAIDRDVAIGFLSTLSHRGVAMGARVSIGSHCNLGLCRIGEQTLLGSGVHVLSGTKQHGTARLDVSIQDQPGTFRSVSIGRRCWIGNHATVMADVGDDTVVAAGSVVTRNVPSRCVVAGNPARVLRERS